MALVRNGQFAQCFGRTNGYAQLIALPHAATFQVVAATTSAPRFACFCDSSAEDFCPVPHFLCNSGRFFLLEGVKTYPFNPEQRLGST